MRGSIQRRGKSYRIVIDKGIDPATKKRRQIVRTARTKAAAEELLRTLLIEHGQGVSHNGDVTVAGLLDDWIRLRAQSLGVTTVRDYRSAIKQHVPEHFLAMKVWKVRTHNVDRLYLDRADAGVGADRIQRLDTILRGAFAQAVRWQWIARNPVIDATRPPVRRRKPTVPDVGEVRALMAAADDWLLLWIALAVHLGARRGEIAALRWTDFDSSASQVTIERALVDGGKGIGIVAKTTKTDRSRTVSIAAPVMARIAEYRRSRLERGLAAGTPIRADGYVFCRDVVGITPVRPDAATKAFGDLRGQLGSTMQLKNLRHFMVTQMLAAGVDVRTVSGRAGHARTSTTLDTYASWLPAADVEAAELMARLLG